MNPDISILEISKTKMERSTYEQSGILAKELEDELMKFTANYEECKVNRDMVEQNKEANSSTNVEVNITECTKSGGQELVEVDYGDVTESSSSFGNSDSEFENIDQLGDSEITSKLCANTVPVNNFDGCSEPIRLRKKKLTNHWRSFIEPLMWRCKWTELQILKLESQAQKYDRELKEHNQRKKARLQNCMPEGHGVKSCQFSSKDARNDLHRRRKRKRTEETMDVVQYMSQHNFFSYYENKKCLARGLLKDDELKNRAISVQRVDVDNELWVDDEQFLFECRDGDNSLELILGKIELLRSQIVDLKSRNEKVQTEEAGKFPFIDETSLLPVKALTSSSRDTSPKNGDRMAGEILPDGEDEVLIDNKRVKEEMNSFEEVKIQSGLSPPIPNNESYTTTMEILEETFPPINNQTPPKTCSISSLATPKVRRKGRKRKGAGRRGRRRST